MLTGNSRFGQLGNFVDGCSLCCLFHIYNLYVLSLVKCYMKYLNMVEMSGTIRHTYNES